MFRVNNKNTRTTTSSVSIVDFEQVNFSYEGAVFAKTDKDFRLLSISKVICKIFYLAASLVETIISK